VPHSALSVQVANNGITPANNKYLAFTSLLAIHQHHQDTTDLYGTGTINTMDIPGGIYQEKLELGTVAPMAPYSNFVNLNPKRSVLIKLWDFLVDGCMDPFGTVIESEEFT